MEQFVKCVNNDYNVHLTIGKKYEVLGHEKYMTMVKNDMGNEAYYNNERFSPCEEKEGKENNIHDKLNSLKDLVLFMANKQTTTDIEEFDILKNLIDNVEKTFQETE